MAIKIYLSAAAHEHDNPTECPVKCSENTHNKAYMDIMERRLNELGFDVRREFREEVGATALRHRVDDANKWGADIYYVSHTNAGGGRRSMTLCWDDAASINRAKIIGKYRKYQPHRYSIRKDLYEIRKTVMPCIYDELFFHDNAEDCAWFHNGGMEQMAEETLRGLCEICGVKYVAPKPPEPPKPKKVTVYSVTANGLFATEGEAKAAMNAAAYAGMESRIVRKEFEV